MNRKDIALTVLGVVATMALAYAFYKRQQSDAAAAATQSAQVQDQTSPNYYSQGSLYDASAEYLYGGGIGYSTSTPSYYPTSGNSIYSNGVDTSVSTAATNNSAPAGDATDIVAQTIAAYAANSTARSQMGSSNPIDTSYSPLDLSSLVIPTISQEPAVQTTNVPTTASDALAQAEQTLSTNQTNPNTISISGVTGGAVNSPSTAPVAVTTAPLANAHYNHIVQTNAL